MRDSKDRRAKCFLHLVEVLRKMLSPPEYVFFENIPQFHDTKCYDKFMSVLVERGYEIEEYLLSPQDPWIAIPYSRQRIYILAIKKYDPKPYTGHIYKSFTEVFGSPPEGIIMKPLGDYLEPDVDGDDPRYKVPFKFFASYYYYHHHVVQPTSFRCRSFKVAYTNQLLIGSGSMLQTKNFDKIYAAEDMDWDQYGLRFFTAPEIARFHSLPLHNQSDQPVLKFPDDYSDKMIYRLLGNSSHVKVASLLLKRLFRDKLN